ncbi:MAG: hypothetical protein ACKO2V_02565, partial [Snowella sp.]
MGESLKSAKTALPESSLPLPNSMGESLKSSKPALPDSSFRWVMISLGLGLLITGGTIVYGLKSTKTGASESTAPTASPVLEKEPEVVSALGRIEPVGEVIKLAATPTMGGAKISRILVPEGAKVKAGEVIAIMDDYDRKVAALLAARESVKVARA